MALVAADVRVSVAEVHPALSCTAGSRNIRLDPCIRSAWCSDLVHPSEEESWEGCSVAAGDSESTGRVTLGDIDH